MDPLAAAGYRGRSARAAALFLILLGILLAACSLEVKDLPVNRLPVVGPIEISPHYTEIQPSDSVRLSVGAEDPDGDEMFFTWASSAGSWANGQNRAREVVWIAPGNFSAVDSIHLNVNVYDFDQALGVRRYLDFAVEIQFGDLRVSVRDLAGNPALVRLAVSDGADTVSTAAPVSEHLFENLAWGNQFVFNYASDIFHGADLTSTPPFAGYADTVFIEGNAQKQLELIVAPKSLLIVPGVPDTTLSHLVINDIQAGIDFCRDHGIDSLLLRRAEFDVSPPAGSRAALSLTGADLALMAFPGEGIVDLDIEGGADFGIELAGRSAATRVERLAVRGAAASGAYLRNSKGRFDTVLFEDCGTAGIFLQGGPGDLLRLHAVELRGCDHGLSVSGGRIEADSLTVSGCAWYGIWLRDGAVADLEELSLVDNRIAGLFCAGAGEVLISHSLIALNGTGIFNQAGVSPLLDCNLFWANPSGHTSELVDPGVHQIADPLFCDQEAGDWRVEAASPALAGDCAPMGAWGDCSSPATPFKGGH